MRTHTSIYVCVCTSERLPRVQSVPSCKALILSDLRERHLAMRADVKCEATELRFWGEKTRMLLRSVGNVDEDVMTRKPYYG